MRDTSNTMYKIGKIWNIVALALCGVWFLVEFILLIVAAINGWYVGGYVSGMITALFEAAFNLVVLIIMPKQLKTADEDKTNPAPHIVLIIFGALSWNPFLILGGIFGLVANGQESNGSSDQKSE